MAVGEELGVWLWGTHAVSHGLNYSVTSCLLGVDLAVILAEVTMAHFPLILNPESMGNIP